MRLDAFCGNWDFLPYGDRGFSRSSQKRILQPPSVPKSTSYPATSMPAFSLPKSRKDPTPTELKVILLIPLTSKVELE
jgi:hypothetical protein